MAIKSRPDPLSLAFAALADPTRRAILARLAQGEADVSELVEPFQLSQPTISKHLKVLEQAGLVARRQVAQRRPRALTPGPLKEIDSWLQAYRVLWESKFSSLDKFLSDLQSNSEPGAEP